MVALPAIIAAFVIAFLAVVTLVMVYLALGTPTEQEPDRAERTTKTAETTE